MQNRRIEEYAEELGRLLPAIGRNIPVAAPREMPPKILHMDVSASELFVLSYLSSKREPNMSEIGKALGIDFSTLTRLVDKLTDKSLVERRSDSQDRRVVRVSIITKGKELMAGFEKEKTKRILSILKRLSDAEIKNLLEIMRTVHRRISPGQT